MYHFLFFFIPNPDIYRVRHAEWTWLSIRNIGVTPSPPNKKGDWEINCGPTYPPPKKKMVYVEWFM